MATNTAALKTFARQTRVKLVSLVTTKLQYVLNADTAELRGYEAQITRLRREIAAKSEQEVIEEVAYTWFNRVMALRYMDANDYNSPKVVTPVMGNMRPEILQDAMGGIIDDELRLSPEEKMLPEEKLYRKLLVAVCNKMNGSMPFLFELLSDYTELLLPDDLLSAQSFVTDIRNGMTDEDCQNVEIIGWLYQFYITDRKADAETNKSKKGGLKSDEQAAATQLFTPHWIVRYMVENSLGRIWMTIHPKSPLKTDMPYYIDTPDGQTDVIPEEIHSVKDIRFLDPCMGSGHILVYAFDLLCKMYEEEGYMTNEIPGMVLENNIFGMDIDLRCYQLTCFALTMKARAYYSRYLRHTVQPNVIALKKVDHDLIASCDAWPTNSLMWQFEYIDTIGSLLKITEEEYEKIPVSTGLFGSLQKELKEQARFLSRKYHCVVTNPPYLGKGMGNELKAYIEGQYPNTKGDIMATFMERNADFATDHAKVSMINQDSWMFTVTYEPYRTHLLSSDIHIDSLIHLGPHAFAEIGGEKVKSTAFTLSKGNSSLEGLYISVYDSKNHIEKELDTVHAINNRECGYFYHVSQEAFTHIEGHPISFWGSEKVYETFSKNRPLSAVCKPTQGLATADNGRFLRTWFEVSIDNVALHETGLDSAAESNKKWFPYNKGGARRRWYGNQELLVNWENNGYEIRNYAGAVVRNPNFYFKPCISWGLISGPLFRYFPSGFVYDVQGMSCFFNTQEQLFKELAWMNTNVFNTVSKIISPAGHIQIGEVGNMPCCDNAPENIEEIAKQNISISKKDWDAHETSWDFQVNELVWMATHATAFDITRQEDIALPIALLVDSYKEKWTEMFYQLHHNEEELNRQFIEIYGLKDELTPDVPLNEVTILQKGEISIEEGKVVWHEDVLIKQLISYLIGCFMGRYSVDKSGLIIASQGISLDSLDLPKRTLEIDDDAIIPIISEPDFFVDDMTQRIEKAVRIIFGESAFYDNMRYIKACLGKDLRDYLFTDFYNEHIKMYTVKSDRRPVYWLFSSKMGDQKKTGCFKALVYMHRLEPDTLSRMHAEYVLPYRNKLEQQLREANDEASRDDLSTAARNRAIRTADELKAKVREVREYETVLVEMASHRLSIDLDEGVRINYPKYYPLVEPIKGLDSVDE